MSEHTSIQYHEPSFKTKPQDKRQSTHRITRYEEAAGKAYLVSMVPGQLLMLRQYRSPGSPALIHLE